MLLLDCHAISLSLSGFLTAVVDCSIRFRRPLSHAQLQPSLCVYLCTCVCWKNGKVPGNGKVPWKVPLDQCGWINTPASLSGWWPSEVCPPWFLRALQWNWAQLPQHSLAQELYCSSLLSPPRQTTCTQVLTGFTFWGTQSRIHSQILDCPHMVRTQ